ncbi:MAG: polyhydroxyalkanoate depolymerase, partial [Aestuariivirgaceae bacterium]
MLYYLYELNHAAVAPWRNAANLGRYFWKNPANPMSDTQYARSITAPLDMFERLTRRYGKPGFDIESTIVDGIEVPVEMTPVLNKPFCTLLKFERQFEKQPKRAQRQKLLIVAPMSGHYATLLRGTVADMLPYADVYITDWVDARQVPLAEGSFDLDDYIDYVIEMLQLLGPGSHVMAVCQPSVPVL